MWFLSDRLFGFPDKRDFSAFNREYPRLRSVL